MATDLAKTATTGLTPVQEKPAFLAGVEAIGTEGLAQKIRPSFVKIIQKNSSNERLTKFGNKAMILTPDEQLIASENETVSFCVLHHYIEFCKHSPMKLKGIEPTIVERSFDDKSPVAVKSMSSATWKEEHPKYPGDEKYCYRYCEHFNFIVKLMDEELQHLEPAVVSFYKTNYSVGQRLAKLILQRRAPVFSGVYSLGNRIRASAENEWNVFTVDNNAEQSWVTDPAIYQMFSEQNEYYKDLQKKRQIETVYDDEDEDANAAVVDGESAPY